MQEEKLPPLFWPVTLKDGIMHMLDETLLPDKVVYLKLNSHKEVARAIKEMRTRAFGQVLAVMYALEMVILQNKEKPNTEILKVIKEASFALEESRPTLPFKDITKMVIFWAYEDIDRNAALGEFLIKRIEGFLEGIKMARMKRAKKAADLLGSNSTVLTHCNVSGEMVLIGESARKQGKKVRFICTETRPYFQGSRLTAWELKEAGFEVVLIADNAIGAILSKRQADFVIVGSDRLAQNGDFANKIGTYPIAVLAREYKIPFIVLTQMPSENPTGDSIPIEERNEDEILKFNGKAITYAGVTGFYPAFDITKKEFITEAISF